MELLDLRRHARSAPQHLHVETLALQQLAKRKQRIAIIVDDEHA